MILTNAHVVNDAKAVTVRMVDRREFAAQVLGSDTITDIAVLRIAAQGLPTVPLGDPWALQVGDPVLAIGAPYGLEQTATAGIVGAKGRSLPGDAAVPFIQTDAAVNPGNSGGPLFDAAGNVVGINSQIYSRTGGFQGVSFAIPVDLAMRVSQQIVATGRAQHARLGVSVQDLTQPLANRFGLPRPDGALVAHLAGVLPLAIFAAQPRVRGGVFYPLQTFSPGRAINWPAVPLCIEAADLAAEATLLNLAGSLSQHVLRLDSAKRLKLHVAAVFANNFTNHLLGIADALLAEAALPATLLAPLVRETVDKALAHAPFTVQTGPATRHDGPTLAAHQAALAAHPAWQMLYSQLTASIQTQLSCRSRAEYLCGGNCR